MRGIRKTKTNIFLLFFLGLIIGIVCGLRHSAPVVEPEQTAVQQPVGGN